LRGRYGEERQPSGEGARRGRRGSPAEVDEVGQSQRWAQAEEEAGGVRRGGGGGRRQREEVAEGISRVSSGAQVVEPG
jgi:hypothetical protein